MLSTIEFSSPLFVRVQTKKHPRDDDYDFEKDTLITGFIIPTHFDHAVDGRKLLYEPEGFYTPEYFYLALLTPNKPLKLAKTTRLITYDQKPADCDGMVFTENTFPMVAIEKSADFTLTRITDDYSKLF